MLKRFVCGLLGHLAGWCGGLVSGHMRCNSVVEGLVHLLNHFTQMFPVVELKQRRQMVYALSHVTEVAHT